MDKRNEEEAIAHLEALVEYYRRKITEIENRIESIQTSDGQKLKIN